jgi:hypothetical protein
MIPRIIHYCWFGKKPMTESAMKYIRGWEKLCPEFELIAWDEQSFDVSKCDYTREAYERQKWAFVADYVRLYALNTFGGIYMDTDIELLRPLDRFLSHAAFCGFESEKTISTGIIGGCAKVRWIELLFENYMNKRFIQPDGHLDLTTNVEAITKLTVEHYGIKLNNTYQEFGDGLVIYPKDFFCPKNYETGVVEMSMNSHCIHHFDSSWISRDRQRYKKLSYLIVKSFGVTIGKKVMKLLYFLLVIKEEGLIRVMQRVVTRRFCSK